MRSPFQPTTGMQIIPNEPPGIGPTLHWPGVARPDDVACAWAVGGTARKVVRTSAVTIQWMAQFTDHGPTTCLRRCTTERTYIPISAPARLERPAGWHRASRNDVDIGVQTS